MESYIKLTKPYPKKNANICSKIAFGWIFGLFSKCLKEGLEVTDLYETMPSDKAEAICNLLEKNWNIELQRAETKSEEPSLLRAIRKTFFWSYMFNGILLLLLFTVLKPMEPFVLAIFIGLFAVEKNKSEPNADNLNAMCLYGGLISLLSLAGLFYHTIIIRLSRIGMRVRIACSSLVYRKMLRLSDKTLKNSSSGHIINLLSNDVSRFDLLAPMLHHLWIMPIQVTIVTYLMWQQVKVSALIGVSFLMISTLPVYGIAAKLSYMLRLKIASQTDIRVKKMAEIITGIKVIKMYAWEKPFSKIVKMVRMKEVRIVTWATYLRGFVTDTFEYLDKVVPAVTIISYVLFGHTLTPDKVFSIAKYFHILLLSVSVYFPIATRTGGEVLASIKRLQKFLLLDERVIPIKDPNVTKAAVQLINIEASWEQNSPMFNINLNVRPGSLCAILGPVGAGKSTIFRILLGELVPTKGSMEIGGEMSYSSQEPWLFSSTIRKNILFGQQFDQERYERVIKSCALARDFQVLPYGDQTLVGEKGVILSGGQKARINLARAIYRNADIYLLDDPLSAVDTHVSNHLFEECILGHLKNKTRILVTHQLQFLHKADHLVVINNGEIEAQGSYFELSNTNLDFTNFLVTAKEDSGADKPQESFKRKSSQHVLNDNDSKLKSVDAEENEERSPLKLNLSVYWKYARAGGNIFVWFGFIMIAVCSQVLCTSIDLWLAYWTQREPSRGICEKSNFTSTPAINLIGVGDKVYRKYFYSNNNESKSSESNDVDISICHGWIETNFTIYIYITLIIAFTLTTLVKAFYLSKITMNASKNLHTEMFSSLLQVPLRFFDINPSGRILNRFSSDMGIIDEDLPSHMHDASAMILLSAGILVVVCMSNIYMIAVAVLLAIAYYKVVVCYFRITGNIKHLEGITRSPVFTHINDTLNGISTIRALSTESILVEEFDWHQDTHTSAWYIMLACTASFDWLLDFLSCIFITCVTFGFIIMNHFSAVEDSMVGLALSLVTALTGIVQHGITQVAELVSKFTSVDRVLEYTALDKEGPQETETDKVPLENWPNEGGIKFHQIYLRYSKEDEPVLKDLNFTVEGGEKIGIVGRTGAGKSSIIAALFRLVPVDGIISIDAVRTDIIGLNDLRRRMSIIPQDPVLFCGSLRYNLDPFEEYSDEEIWNALDIVELKGVVDSLEFKIDEAGSNFSVGQKQLVCLARAILRKNKILVMDEATANVDAKTDALIQETIRSTFSACTVLTVAHRLHTVMDSDKILVMDEGKLLEFDRPHRLLANPNGYLYRMVAQSGESMAQQLHKIAEKAYLKIAKNSGERTYL